MKKLYKFLFVFIILLCPIYNIKAEELGEIKSNNAILYNLNDNSIIFEKNSDDKVLIASMTKIMTGIVAIENISNLDEKVVLTSKIFQGLSSDLSMAGFKLNETVTYRDLLYGALLPSGGDATHSLAMFISGSEENYVKLMNDKAIKLGLNNTHFQNSIGIEDDNNTHFSTVKDVSILFQYAIKNKEFKKIFMSDNYTTSDGLLKFKSSKKKAELKYDLDLSFINGSKTGYTSKAGLCLASISSYNGVDYLLVTAGADYRENKVNHFLDAEKIYKYYFENYEYKKVLSKGDTLKKLKTKYDEEVIISSKKNVYLYLKKDIKKSDLKYKYNGKIILDKTIRKDKKIGTYSITYNNKVLYKDEITSPIDVHFRLKKQYIVLILIILVTLLTIKLIKLRIRKIIRRKRRRIR